MCPYGRRQSLQTPSLREHLQQLGRFHFQCLGELPDNLQPDIGLTSLDTRRVGEVHSSALALRLRAIRSWRNYSSNRISSSFQLSDVFSFKCSTNRETSSHESSNARFRISQLIEMIRSP